MVGWECDENDRGTKKLQENEEVLKTQRQLVLMLSTPLGAAATVPAPPPTASSIMWEKGRPGKASSSSGGGDGGGGGGRATTIRASLRTELRGREFIRVPIGAAGDRLNSSGASLGATHERAATPSRSACPHAAYSHESAYPNGQRYWSNGQSNGKPAGPS